MTDFNQFDLPEQLRANLAKLNYTAPTPIQEKAIPVALQGHDILGSAQTGTGKTAAFSIPVIAHLMKNPKATALIMSPTRELAAQINKAVMQMSGMRTALLIGGDSMAKQMTQLRSSPRFIIGTPGRINDHLERRSLGLDSASYLVLDETDRMLDMGFGIQIARIIKMMPQDRQTLMFSATLPSNITQLSQKYLKEPVRISMGDTSKPALNIEQKVITLQDGDKYERLLAELGTRSGSVIIFVKTKHGTEKMAKKLSMNFSAEAIHGDLKQRQRDRVIQQFRNYDFQILVATDVAARGLDIPHIEHVINYDLPQAPEDYIHRIGRTARNGASGEAIAFVTPSEMGKWRAIQRLVNPGAKQERFEGGEEERSSHPRRSFGGPKRFNNGGDRDRGGFRNDRSDRAPRSNYHPADTKRASNNDRPARNFDDRAPRPSEDRAPRSFEGRAPRSFEDRPPRNFDDRPPRSFDDRAERSANGEKPRGRPFRGQGFSKKKYGQSNGKSNRPNKAGTSGGFKKRFDDRAA
jgi:ATP-dependent RNA helicase DeaD